jgi:tRNA pseudouridine38-40 synthase
MNRYFLEVRYKGTNYAGFQKQRNAPTIQSAVEEALGVYFRNAVGLTGSSRTDTGVHALQNYFHFDIDQSVLQESVYNLNALLPPDIAVTRLIAVKNDQHCRFDAVARTYQYRIYQRKDPFLNGLAYYYPFKPDMKLLEEVAGIVRDEVDFSAFSKRNSQVKHFRCTIKESLWEMDGPCLVYRVQANRFLRGMVKGLVGTMLQVGRGNMEPEIFKSLFRSDTDARVDFSVPGHGLILQAVEYPPGFFEEL